MDEALASWLGSALLLALRLAPLVLLAPWLAAGYAPRLVQLAITACLVVCLMPSVLAAPLALPDGPLLLALLAVRELLIGLVLAVALAVPVLAARWGGELIGLSIAGPDQDAPYARFYDLFAAALFVTLGGHRIALAALARSLERAPLAQLSAPSDALQILTGSALLLGDAAVTAILIALPVLIALALTDALLALLARLASVAFLPDLAGTSRALAALAVVWMSLAALAGALPQWFDSALARALMLWSSP
jgi:type III secretory pathway component EscT